MKRNGSDWNKVFDSIFEKLKAKFEKDYPGTSYEKSNPAEAAYAEFHRSLPVPVKLMSIRLEPSPLHTVKDGLGYIVSFDLKRLGDSRVVDMGRSSCSLEEFFDILQREFGSTDWQQFPPTEEFPLSQFSDWDPEQRWFTMFLPFDIRENAESLYSEMWLAFRSSIWMDITTRLTFEISFNREYDLESDEVLPKRELLKPARPGAERWDIQHPEKGRVKLTLRNLQKDVGAIQLIPDVPKGVRDILETAKRLYVFTYFDESFRQVSEHYAALALESALKERYWRGVKQPIELKNRKGETQTLNQASYSHVFRLCVSDRRWNRRNVKINGKPFLHTTRQLLDFFEEEKLLTRWERDMCRLVITVRNTLSHPSSISTMPSSIGWLELATRFINTLYIEPSRKQRLLEEHRRRHGLMA